MRRPNFDFVEMGIPMGARLQFVEGGAEAIVAGRRKVVFGGGEVYLTAATREALGLEGAVCPGKVGLFWLYGGRVFSELYEETYGKATCTH